MLAANPNTPPLPAAHGGPSATPHRWRDAAAAAYTTIRTHHSCAQAHTPLTHKRMQASPCPCMYTRARVHVYAILSNSVVCMYTLALYACTRACDSPSGGVYSTTLRSSGSGFNSLVALSLWALGQWAWNVVVARGPSLAAFAQCRPIHPSAAVLPKLSYSLSPSTKLAQ